MEIFHCILRSHKVVFAFIPSVLWSYALSAVGTEKEVQVEWGWDRAFSDYTDPLALTPMYEACFLYPATGLEVKILSIGTIYEDCLVGLCGKMGTSIRPCFGCCEVRSRTQCKPMHI